MHPEKVTAWCGMNAESINGKTYLKTENGANITDNDERYKQMIAPFGFLRQSDRLVVIGSSTGQQI